MTDGPNQTNAATGPETCPNCGQDHGNPEPIPQEQSREIDRRGDELYAALKATYPDMNNRLHVASRVNIPLIAIAEFACRDCMPQHRGDFLAGCFRQATQWIDAHEEYERDGTPKG
jgi:hypothetical protein